MEFRDHPSDPQEDAAIANRRAHETRRFESLPARVGALLLLTPADFRDATGAARSNWTGLMELRLGSQETLRAGMGGAERSLRIGSDWSGPRPEFRNLRWQIASALAPTKINYPSSKREKAASHHES